MHIKLRNYAVFKISAILIDILCDVCMLFRIVGVGQCCRCNYVVIWGCFNPQMHFWREIWALT